MRPDFRGPDGRGGVCGLNTIAQVPATQVYLFGRGDEIGGMVVDGDLHDDLYLQNPQIPLDLEICCPRCGEWLHIDGTKKRIQARYLRHPKRFAHPADGDLAVQTAVVTIEDDLTCSQERGKSVCGLHFRITENVMHKI